MKATGTFNIADSLMTAHATNDRINHYLIQHLPSRAWSAKPPGGKGRSIPGIVGHMHSVRLMWLKSAAPSAEMPAKLDGDGFSKEQAVDALTKSNEALRNVLAGALAGDGRVRGFKPDGCSFLAYLFAHDAHHRGQITMLARQLGHPLPQGAMYGLWEWGTR